ncbi:hypothetical protein ACSBR1_004539 [Camellia fascicularis]
MAGNIVLSFVVKIGEYLVAPVSRQFGYLIFYETNINNLENQVLKLEDKKFGVEQLVVAAETKRETIGPDVKRWLTAVNELSQEATEFIEHEVKANKGCLNGWCPNLKSRYSLSRKATKKTQVVEKLCGEGNFPRVSYPEPPVGMASTVTRGFKHFESRRSIMKEVMKALADDSINMIGICGMGGVGKTTMVKEVEKRAKEGNVFNEVVIGTVSQSPEVKKIQGEIADILQFKIEEETELGRSRRLCARLKTIKRILVILDDVWKSIELNDIGIPFGDDHKGCKILLTSRFDYVCDDMGAQQKFTVEVLPKEEAWNLFKEIAGISDDPSPTTDLHCTQIEVANECGGLPIAIVTVGRALRAKVQSSWDSALSQLRKSIVKNIRGVDEKVFKSLELSYNYLESKEAQKLFLFCSLYPEDFDIPIEDLVRYGIGLELFKGTDTIGEARDIVHDVIDYLKKCYLLIDSERTECVKIHDIIRDVAISIASREEHLFMVRCDKALEDWPEKDRLKNYVVISLKLNGMHGLPGLELPKLQLLNLDCNAGLPSMHSFDLHKRMEEVKVQETPDSFYQGMKELRVLALSDIYGSLPTSLRNLTNLRTLSLFRCRLIDDDASVIGALENLEILRFADSCIKELPKEIIGHLAHLKVLDLLNCKVERIYPGVLSSLSMLQELYIGSSFKRLGDAGKEESMERTNAIIAELASLSNLVALDIDLLNIKSLPRDWVIEKVKKFNITVHPSRSTTARPYYLLPNKLNLGSLDVTDLMDSNLKMLLKSTKILALESIKGLKDILSDLDKDGFEHLTNLSVSYCDDLEYLINKPDELVLQRAFPFPVLENMHLSGLNNFKGIICHGQLQNFLPELTHLWMGPPPLKWLGNLRFVYLNSCDKLESVFSLSMAKNLVHLEKIKISECCMMEVIVSNEGEDHEIAAATTDKVEFPKLKSMFLWKLPSFTAFGKAMNAIELPQLECLDLMEIPKLNSFCPSSASASAFAYIQSLFDNKVKLTSLEKLSVTAMDNLIEIWPDELQAKLREMRVKLCHGFSNILFPSNLIKGMQSLELLEVKQCRSVKVLFDLEGLITREGHPDIQLHSLTNVNLRHLPKLTHVWKDNLLGIQGLQNLTSLIIKGCGSLRYIFPASLAKLLGKLQEIEVIECGVMEAIIDKEPEVGYDVTTNICIFPQLRSLKFCDLPNLRSLCLQTCTFEGTLLKIVKVINCPNLKALPSAFQCLQELRRSNVQKEEFFNSAQHHFLDGKFSLSSKGELTVTGIDGPTEIWHYQLGVGCLHKVRVMWIQCCRTLLSIVSSNLIQRLHKVEELKVWWCDSLEMIFDLKEEVCVGVGVGVGVSVVVGEKGTSITQLSKLELKYLPKLTHIWKCFPQQTHCFRNLSYLKVKNCDNLRYIFTISMAKVLVNLKDLIIRHCEKVEKIVTRENEEEEIHLLQFRRVELHDLPSLVCFGPNINDTQIPADQCWYSFVPNFQIMT